MSAGAAITAQIIYEAVTGTAKPTNQTTNIVKKAVNKILPLDNSITIDENFKPRPVNEITPTIIPAPAQVIATFTALIEPLAKPEKNELKSILFVFFINE